MRSERKLAPVREKHARDLRSKYPDLDGVRLALLSNLFARIDLGNAWLDKQGGIVKDRKGEVYAVAREVDRWEQRADRLVSELEAERRAARPAGDLATQMAALGEAEDDEPENGG